MKQRLLALSIHLLSVVLVTALGSGFPFMPLPPVHAGPGNGQLAKQLIEDGLSAYEQGRYEEAASQLTQARSLLPSHSPTVLYLGLAYLKQDRLSEAIAAWQEYLALQPYTGKERQEKLPQTIPGYLTLLLREENHRIAREAAAREQQIGPGDPQTIAITYYRNLGSPELGPLQKGLTALLISDISQVPELKVVERDRLQALLEELQLGATGLVDTQTAPKVGRLLGAGKIATGSFLDPSKEELQMDSVIAESTAAQVLSTQQTSGKLEQFFAVEKNLALAILTGLGYDEQRLRAAGVWDQIRQPQTTSMVALTAFSDGLEAKDRQAYGAARTFFEEALRADPNFELARRELLALPLLLLTTGAIVAAVESSAPSVPVATAGLAGGGLGISSTTLAIGAGTAAVIGGGIGLGIALSDGGGGGGGPECGNNEQEGNESCDGSDLGGATCPSGGTIACSADCSLDFSGCIACGNGVREGSEECDDGNGDNTDVCLTTCVSATCGDSFVQTSVEECDDGNSDNADACLTSCKVASCGDGFIQAGAEECDVQAVPTGCGPDEFCENPGSLDECHCSATMG